MLRLLSPPLLKTVTTVSLPHSGSRQTKRFQSIIVVRAEISESVSTKAANPVPSSTTTFTMVNSQASLIELGRGLRVRPTPQLGLLSLLFVLSMAFGALLCMALISIPTMIAFSKFGASANKLLKVVSEEVPGTLSSFKLSGLEINDMTQQLANLKQKIFGISSHGKIDQSE